MRRSAKSRRPTNPQPDKQGVFSYYSSRSSASSTSPQKGERKHWWQGGWARHLPSFVALGLVTISVLYCLSLSTNPKVVVSTSSPQAVVLRDKNEYQAGAQRILEQSILNRTKFTVNSSGFEKAFKNEFPEVDDVSLTLPIVSPRPIVTISTAQPQIMVTAQSKVYVLDRRGTVIMMANDLSSSIRQNLPVVNDQSGLVVSVGKTVLPADDIQFITGVLAQFKAKGVTAETITLPTTAHEVDIKPAGQPYYVKFSVDTNAREAAGAYLATKQYLDQSHTAPSQYVDVRIPGRAYFQ